MVSGSFEVGYSDMVFARVRIAPPLQEGNSVRAANFF